MYPGDAPRRRRYHCTARDNGAISLRDIARARARAHVATYSTPSYVSPTGRERTAPPGDDCAQRTITGIRAADDTTFARRSRTHRVPGRERKSRAARSSSQPGASDPSPRNTVIDVVATSSLLTLARALLALPAARPSVNAPDTDLPTVLLCVARDIKHKHRAGSTLRQG